MSLNAAEEAYREITRTAGIRTAAKSTPFGQRRRYPQTILIARRRRRLLDLRAFKRQMVRKIHGPSASYTLALESRLALKYLHRR